MEHVERISVSLSKRLLAQFDGLIRRRSYTSRSEAVRDLVRNSLVEAEWETDNGPVVGTVTLVYSHATRELANTLTDLQHRHHRAILCTTHVHLDEHACLEIIAVRGKAREVRRIADRLISTRGVKHGRLVCSSYGHEL